MGWRIDTCDLLNADLADGNFVPIFGLCKRLEWMLQGSVFRVDFWLLLLSSCDMVLGVQWLSELEDIMFNFKKITIKFE